MDQLSQFENQNYLNMETFRKNGQGVPTPVWFVEEGGMLYVRTIANSGKVKRVRSREQVNVMACGRAGEPLGTWIPARAREVTDGAAFARIHQRLVEKYGEIVLQFEAQAAARGQRYTILEITPE